MRYIRIMLVSLMFMSIKTAFAQSSFPRVHGLPVDNYGEELKWSEFREAFLAVDSSNSLDVTLFDMIKGYASDGFCFGMSLLAGAVYVEDGYMGLCKPLGSYAVADSVTKGNDTLTPFWPIFKHAYHVLWARQFSQPMVREIAELVSSGDFQNAVGTFNKVESYLSGNEIPVVLISESLTLSGGTPTMGGMHAVLAYKTEKDVTTWKIYVYDPSRPYISHQDFYRHGQNIITINSTSSTSWSYLGPNGNVWHGFIYTIPGIRLLVPSTNPLLISNLAESVTKIVVNGCDITDVEAEGETADKTMLFPMDFFSSDSTHHFYLLNNPTDGNYRLKLKSDSSYEILIAGNGGVAKIQASGTSGDELISVSGLKSGAIQVEITSSSDNAQYVIDIHKVISPKHINTFTIKPEVMTEGGSLLAGITPDGKLKLSSSLPQNITVTYEEYEDGNLNRRPSAHLVLVPKDILTVAPSKDDNDHLMVESQHGRTKLWAEN